MQKNQQPLKKPAVKYKGNVLKANQCFKTLLGDRIDLMWNMEEASMDIAPSKTTDFFHQIRQKEEQFRGVPLRHREQCHFFEENMQKNDESVVSPCVVVLIQNKQTGKILATQRHQRMSFGNLWVLPGGHLEKGEDIFTGGIRQCEQEVGLPPQAICKVKDPLMMAWESVLLDDKKSKIKRAALVLFFRIECEDFKVKEQKSEVKQFEWRSFKAEENPWGGGWAEGHLRYLQFINECRFHE